MSSFVFLRVLCVLCVSASLRLCVSASLHLCVSASLRLCVERGLLQKPYATADNSALTAALASRSRRAWARIVVML